MVDSVDLAITSPDLEFFENFETELAVAAVNVAAGGKLSLCAAQTATI